MAIILLEGLTEWWIWSFSGGRRIGLEAVCTKIQKRYAHNKPVNTCRQQRSLTGGFTCQKHPLSALISALFTAPCGFRDGTGLCSSPSLRAICVWNILAVMFQWLQNVNKEPGVAMWPTPLHPQQTLCLFKEPGRLTSSWPSTLTLIPTSLLLSAKKKKKVKQK